MASASKNSLSQTKVAILQEVEKFAKECGAKVKIAEKIAEKYEIPKSTLSTIIKKKGTILKAFERSMHWSDQLSRLTRECGPLLTLKLKKPSYHG